MRSILLLLQTEISYRKLLLASLISGTGDTFNNVAILSLLLHLTGTGLAVGLVLAIRILPQLLLGPIAGILADRISRKTILLISDFGRALVAVSFIFVRSNSEIWIVYVASFILVIFSTLFTPARTACIPQLVSSKNVVLANSVEQSLSGIVTAIGSGIGGVVTAIFGQDIAFVFNAASFLLSGLICCTIKFPDYRTQDSNVNRVADVESERQSSFVELLRCSRLIQILALQSVLWPMGGGAINVLLSIYGFRVFHQGNEGIGVLYGALGLGFFVSGLVGFNFSKRIRETTIFAVVIEGICHLLVSRSPDIWLAAVFLAIGTVSAGIGNAANNSLTMMNIPSEYHGVLNPTLSRQMGWLLRKR
ncbi:MFS transporter [Alicyclobacillus contaminans]|uniref:MFS transporter n=1 Tax=Alicyclobacillus contaminans TaxID=392016 RepID=UPI000429F93F|nr:MFS transporter [Alicyclobacillus contaminans]